MSWIVATYRIRGPWRGSVECTTYVNTVVESMSPPDYLIFLMSLLGLISYRVRGPRRGGRAVECTGLENRHRLIAYPGFESSKNPASPPLMELIY